MTDVINQSFQTHTVGGFGRFKSNFRFNRTIYKNIYTPWIQM